jgi:hypothetical protein
MRKMFYVAKTVELFTQKLTAPVWDIPYIFNDKMLNSIRIEQRPKFSARWENLSNNHMQF